MCPMLNKFSDLFLFWKNNNFCDFEKDYTLRFSSNLKIKYYMNVKLEKFSFSTISQLYNSKPMFFFYISVYVMCFLHLMPTTE